MSSYANTAPNTQGFAPAFALDEFYKEFQPDPTDFIFADSLPEKNYEIPIVAYDIVQPVTGLLNLGSHDGTPVLSASRGRKSVVWTPTYRDLMKELRPSDVINQRALGKLGSIDPMELESLIVEELAISTAYTLENDRVQAMLGNLAIYDSLTNTTLNYSYPVWVAGPAGMTPTPDYVIPYSWADTVNSDPIADIIAMRKLLRGRAIKPKLYINLVMAGYLAKNARIVELLRNSVYATSLGPAAGPGGAMVRDDQIGNVLKILTGVEEIVQYDVGYDILNSDGTFTNLPFLPDNRALMVGQMQNNQPLGWYAMTPTVNGNGGFMNPTSGRFLRTIDTTPMSETPRRKYIAGFCGVPCIVFASTIVAITPVF